ncbi:MAG: VWA domain-containing protein [Verrucomicrobiales bacterium]|nr:VWA domain-containing protein [Verrucomicrobiales bacterium]
MSMSFGSPQHFIALAVLVLAGTTFRRLQLWKPFRLLLLVLLVLALCDPVIRIRSGAMDLWVLLDRSLSAGDLVEEGEDEWKSLIARSKPERENRLIFIDYAGEVIPSSNTETGVFTGARDATRTGLALHDTLARMDPNRHHRILLFTDGYSTEPLHGVASKLIQAKVPLDYRMLKAPERSDFRISELKLPTRVQPAEAFLVDLSVTGNTDGLIPVTIYRGNKRLFSDNIPVKGGIGRLRFSDRIARPGAHRYTAEISPELDAHIGNNTHEQWIEVTSGPRILLVTNYSNDPLSTSLRNQGFSVDEVQDFRSLSPGSLTGTRAVIFNNVPAYEIPNDFLNALNFFVKEQGGGFLMAGGKNSFGSGGYYQSAVDELLPVTMELKSEHRRLSVAMAIVMDRSGSMGVTTSSGNTKMQLANEGAARAVELLGDADAVTVFAVDSKAHAICKLLNIGTSRTELINRIRSIESMGGGIYVYTGMKAAWGVLKEAEVGQRHLILFTDASDSEEPGEYKELLEEMQAEGATVSVIGLGAPGDPDAAFIEDIAKRGNGRMFFTTVPGDLPNIFAQETVSVARSTFVEDPVPTQSSGKWHEIARRDLNWPQLIDGYNLSYLRDGDEMALVSRDSYIAPLVAFGRRGTGRTAAITFPLGGEYSQSIRAWENYGDFQQTLGRWLIGDKSPPGIGIRHEITGSKLRLDLIYDTGEWSEKFATSPPRLVIERGVRHHEAERLTWERLSPGHYSVQTELRASEPVRGAVQVADSAIPFGPVVAGSALEWQFDEQRISELKETAHSSGGSELLDLSEAWRPLPSPGTRAIRDWFLIAALVVFLLEAFVSRTGWSFPRWSYSKTPVRKASSSPTVRSKPSTDEAAKPPAPVVPETDQQPTRRTRFQKAKKRH